MIYFVNTSYSFNKSKSAPKADITSALVTSSNRGAAVTTVSPSMVLPSLAMIEFFKSLADIFLISLAVQLNNLFFIFSPMTIMVSKVYKFSFKQAFASLTLLALLLYGLDNAHKERIALDMF